MSIYSIDFLYIFLRCFSPLYSSRNYANYNPSLCVLDSRDLPEELFAVYDPDSTDVFYSMDVVSLFDKVPLDLLCLTIEKLGAAVDRGFIDHVCLMELVSLDLYHLNLFSFRLNGVAKSKKMFYEQVNGIPMGGNTSTVYADIYLSYHLSMLGDLRVRYGIKFIRKYVDDFLVYGSRGSISRFISDYSALTKLAFTVEHMVDGRLPFLDMVLVVQDRMLTTSWYWKPISSLRCVNYFSKAPLQELHSTYVQRFITASIYDSGGSVLVSYHRILSEMYYNGLPGHVARKILRGASVSELGRCCAEKSYVLSHLYRHFYALKFDTSYVDFCKRLRGLPGTRDVMSYVRDDVSSSGRVCLRAYYKRKLLRRRSKVPFGSGVPLVCMPYHGARSVFLRRVLRFGAGLKGLVYRRDSHFTSATLWRKALERGGDDGSEVSD